VTNMTFNGSEVSIDDAYEGQLRATVTFLFSYDAGASGKFGHSVRVQLTVEQDDALSIAGTRQRVLDRAKSILLEAHSAV
jgi:hypothetical protein